MSETSVAHLSSAGLNTISKTKLKQTSSNSRGLLLISSLLNFSFVGFSRGRDRPGERPRDREGRHPPSGPDYHRRTPPISHGSRRSPPPHGPPRAPHRFDERRRSLSPGGRREESYRQGPPRDQGGYGIGREPMRGRGGYPAPFDNRSRPMEGRRRNSPPPRQYVERGRGAPRGRGSRGG